MRMLRFVKKMLHAQVLIGAAMATLSLTIRIDDDLKREATEAAECYDLGLSTATRSLYRQMGNTHGIPLALGPEEPNAESLEAIREGNAFLMSGKQGRFASEVDLIATAIV